MRRALLPCVALLAVLTGTAGTSAVSASRDEPSRSIAECLARLDAQLDIGYQRIVARCPDLTRKLEASGWSAWLPPDWKRSDNDLSAASLKELQRLAALELATHPAIRAPRVGQLAAVLADLRERHRRPGTWRARLTAWLHEPRGSPASDPGAPVGWGQALPPVGLSDALIELLCRAALAVTVVLAALIVVNELRVAGLLRLSRRAAVSAADEASGDEPRPFWSEIEQAPLEERPRLLVTRIAAQLSQRSHLAAAHALTARELTRAAQLPDEEDRRRLGELALTAEHLSFSGSLLPALEIAAAVERGRELLGHLDAAGAGARRLS